MPALFQVVRSQLTVKWRLIWLVALVVAGMVAVGFHAWSTQLREQQSVARFSNLNEQFESTRRVQAAINELRFWQMASMSMPQSPLGGPEQIQPRLLEAEQNVVDALDAYSISAPAQAAELRKYVELLSQAARAAADGAPGQTRSNEELAWQARQATLHKTLGQRSGEAQSAAAEALRNLSGSAAARLADASWLALILLSGTVLFTSMVIRSILRPLEDTVFAIGELASGRLDTPLPEPKPDEIGAITQALHQFRENARRLDYLAFHDPLTGLPNQAAMKEVLRVETARVRETGYCLVLMYVSLDQLETINEIYGPASGDSYLQLAAKRLAAAVPESAQIFHLAGAKFAVLVRDLVNDAELTVKADSIARGVLSGIGQPWQVHQQDIDVSATIGVVTCPQDGLNYEELALNASATLTHARRKGSNSYQFYTRSLTEKARSRLAMASALRRALQEEEFTVHYQPIVDIQDGLVIAAEGLVRWQHPERGLIFPGEFIGVAEETGAINALGEWVLAQGCMDFRTWRKAGMGATKLSINLSTRQLNEAGLVSYIEKTAERTGVPPSALEVEITESAMMVHPERSIRVLRHLKALGVSLAVDDFGTGYSSLAYLQRFPLDKIKIDRSFVSRLHRPKDAAIVTATTQLAATLGLEVVAEGVETPEQMGRLKQMGCRYMQGYLFSKGVPVDDFVHWAQNVNSRTLPRIGMQ